MYKLLILVLLLRTATLVVAQEPDTVEKDYSAELPRIKPLSAEESKQQFEVLEGFEVQLVASEPLVFDPVAFAFDAKGRLWVVEMLDYSEQDKERLGRVAVLQDTDGDGVMDTRSTFVENLSWPTAIWPWLDGVVVADAPQLTWHRDTDGDLVADKSESWFSGFGRSNVQGLVNSFRWGIDGWIHGVTSSAGAELQAADGSTIALGRRDFGIDPLSHRLQPETGGGQHGMCFNRWGDKFVTSNSDHLQQIVEIEGWFADQPNQVTMPTARKSIAEDGPQAEVYRASPIEPWRIVRTRLRLSGVTPGIVEGGGRPAGYFTGATGTCILDAELGFGAAGEMHDTAIVCDVGSNLVHRKRLVDQRLFYNGQRLDQQTELLRSRDIWFRPVQIGEGPDGALYIADMYREVIEHPLSLPPMIKKHLDLTSGRDKGRIWRLISKSVPPQPIPNMAAMDDLQLVLRLGSSISVQRLMASQVLTERFASQTLHGTTMTVLEKAAISAVSPEARLLSLNLLSRLGGWNAKLSTLALDEKHPRVLAQAIELVARSENAKSLAAALRSIAVDSDDNRVQLALAKISTQLDPNDRQAILSTLLPKVTDPLVQAVVATAAGVESWKLLQSSNPKQVDDQAYQRWLVLWLPLWTTQVAQNSELSQFISSSLESANPRQAAWLGGLARVNSSGHVLQLLAATNAQSTIDRYLANEMEKSLSVELVRWLRLASPELQTKWLPKLIHQSTPESLQIAGIDSLSWSNHVELTAKLIDSFRGLTPSVQLEALRAIVSRQDRLSQLVVALKQQKISRSQIPAEIRQALLSQRDKELAAQFKEFLEQISTDRAAVLQQYSATVDKLVEESGARTKGMEVFRRVCSQCHRLGDLGNDVGPPLKQLGDKSPQQLLESILDPSREVDPKYTGYSFLLEDGAVINGIILQESGQQIVVGEAGGKRTTLDRRSIEEMKSSGLSLMPTGLEEQITPQQMNELIQFLKTP